MRAVQLTAFGNPVDGLEYVDIPEPRRSRPQPGPHRRRVFPHQPERPHGRTGHLCIPPPASNRHCAASLAAHRPAAFRRWSKVHKRTPAAAFR